MIATLEDLVSEDYAAQLRQLHATSRWGKYTGHHAEEIAAFADLIGADTILDYGAGKGTLKPILGSRVREFDPGIPAIAAIPEPADLVVATDVLEHIEPDRVDVTLAFMRSLAVCGAFLIIATTPARQLLPNGENAHLTVRPASWWLTKLRHAGFKVERVEPRKGLFVWAR